MRSASGNSRRAGHAVSRRALPFVAACVALVVVFVAFAPTGAADRPSSYRLSLDGQGTTLSRSRLARSSVSWTGGAMTATTGETVNVFVSSTLPQEFGTAQSWADFIAGLLHGPEISSLTAYVATFGEMQEICGRHALGCYRGGELVSMGETMYGITATEVVRHEYGHHIAFNRTNSPWTAVDWGPKAWASEADICRRAAQRTVFPGDEGDRYTLNPGEAWAETYRVLDERRSGATGSGWELVDASFAPDEASLTAAEHDVVQPWAAPKSLVRRMRFTPRSRAVWTTRFDTPLDGTVQFRITLPRGGLHEVILLDANRRVLATGLWASATLKTMATTVCGERELYVRVTRRGAPGRVAVSASIP